MGKTAESFFLEDFLKKNTNLSPNYRVLSSTEFSGAGINWLFSGDAGGHNLPSMVKIGLTDKFAVVCPKKGKIMAKW